MTNPLISSQAGLYPVLCSSSCTTASCPFSAVLYSATFSIDIPHVNIRPVLQKQQQQLGFGPMGPVSPLEILRQISEHAPTEPRVYVDELAIDPERGRFCFAAGDTPPPAANAMDVVLTCDLLEGFSGDVGARSFDRAECL